MKLRNMSPWRGSINTSGDFYAILSSVQTVLGILFYAAFEWSGWKESFNPCIYIVDVVSLPCTTHLDETFIYSVHICCSYGISFFGLMNRLSSGSWIQGGREVGEESKSETKE